VAPFCSGVTVATGHLDVSQQLHDKRKEVRIVRRILNIRNWPADRQVQICELTRSYSGELKQPMSSKYLHVYVHVFNIKRPAGFASKTAARSRNVVSLMACVDW
jgi:hypothetical protein